MLPKDFPKRFFNPLTSKHREAYIHVLLNIEQALEEAKRIALPRSALVAELRRMFQRENFSLDVSDEEEYDEEPSGDIEQDNLAFTIRLFLRSEWIDLDETGDYSSDLLFITLYGKKLSGFLKDLSKMDSQSGHVVNTYSNLQQVRMMPDSGFICILNAYESTERLLTSLEMMYSKIKKYYDAVLVKTRPEALLDEHLYGYVQDVVDKLIYPIKVDDSVDRFRGPILDVLQNLEGDTKLLERIISSAVQTKRIQSEKEGWVQVLQMLNFIESNFDHIESYIQQLDEKNQTYIRITRQKLTYMLSMDTSVKGNIIALLRDAKNRPEDEWTRLSQCINMFDVKCVSEDSSRFQRKRKERLSGEELLIESDITVSEEDIDSIIDTRARKYVMSNVNDFVRRAVAKHGSITGRDFAIEGDDDYLMAIFLAMNSTDSRSEYSYEYSKDVVSKGRYKIPDFTIKGRRQ